MTTRQNLILISMAIMNMCQSQKAIADTVSSAAPQASASATQVAPPAAPAF